MYPVKDATTNTNVNEIKTAASNIKSDARSTAREIESDVNATASRTRSKVRTFLHNASDEIHHATDSVNHQIHDKPLQSTLVALGAGFILGALLVR